MMDRLAQSPLRIATLQRKAAKKYRPSATQDLNGTEAASGNGNGSGSRKRRLAPLANKSPGSCPPAEKACKEYELALQRRDFQQILWMITNGDVPATYETFGGETALLAAIAARNTDAFRLVTQCEGVSVNDRNRHGYTPMMKAIAAAAPFAEASHADSKARPRLEKPRNQSTKETARSNNNLDDSNRQTAAESRDRDIFDNCMVECVLGLSPDLHTRDAAGQTAFDWAARLGNQEAVHMMEAHLQQLQLQHADFADRDSRLRECEELLRRHDAIAVQMETLLRIPLLQETELIQFVKNTPPDLTEFNVTNARLDYESITRHSTSNVEKFFQEYFLNRETRDGWTPLTKAAACGYTEAVRMLLSLPGVDVLHESSRLKHTALTWASCCGHESVVLLLLREAGVLLHYQTREGKTALMHAVSNQQLVVMRHLLHATHEYSVRRASGKETFHYNENAIRRHNSAKRKPTRWGGRPVSTPPGSKRKPGTEEWHHVFLDMLRVQDQHGRDVESYATALGADTESARAIQQELQHALSQALDHEAYVATHMTLTMPTMCKYASDGCDFMAPLDLLPTHELHECTKRRIDCERCGESIAHIERQAHDQVDCEKRVVPCVNRQHGCDAMLVWSERESHERDHCRKRLVECRLGCGRVDGQLKYDERDAHETTQCVLRLIECKQNCGVPPFPANTSGKHKRNECVKRLVKCTGGKTGTGGCGKDVAVDQMDFHVVSLCESRRLPCKWSHHGCRTWIGGAADSRRHHEDAECPFRLVECKNDGCRLSGTLLACFLEEHYAWQCSLEPKPCPHACGDGVAMASHWLDAHTQSDSGDCCKRLTRCRLDLCGKTLRLFDSEKVLGSARLTSDVSAAGDGEARVSMRALRQRLDRETAFLERLKLRHGEADDEHDEDEEEAEVVDGEAEFWHSRTARKLLLTWLEPRHAQLQSEWASVAARKQEQSALVRVLSFNSETALHMVEFQRRDGHCEWIDLALREYEVQLPSDKSSNAAVKSGQAASAFSFNCSLLVAGELSKHESLECGLRLVPCPLECGQRLTSQSISHHLSKRCNLRNAKCRLGCGVVLPFLQLSEHEDALCELRQTHCEHCHEAMAHRVLAVHLANRCTQLPRRCRFGCPMKIPSSQFAVHESEECPKRLVPCAKCEKQVWFCEQENHANEECALRVFGSCDAGCGRTLRVNERAYHLLYDCIMRKLPCPQCREVVVWKDLTQHKQLLCVHRHVYCRRGCGQQLQEIDSASHEAHDCERRIVDCTNRCGEQVSFAGMHAHVTLQCSMRVVTCPHGCDEKLFAYQCETHWKRCRQRLCECGAGSKHCARPIRLWISQRRLVRCKTHQESGLLWALKTQDDDLVAYFLQNIDHNDDSSGVNTEFANGFTALSLVASMGSMDIAKLLLRAGADVNQETSRGRSPLMEATMAQDVEMVALLLEHRASVGHVNRHGASVLSVAESFAASDPDEYSNAQRVLKLLRTREELESDQRALFTAIACSDYEYVAQLVKYSSGIATASLSELEQQVQEKQQAFDLVKHELDESVKLLNESIADTEAKTTHSQRMRERVEDCKTQIAKIESFHEASLADSNALEAEMLSHIREITAIDIAKLLNTNTPPPEYLVVMKSICLFCGVMPRGRRNASEYSDMEWWKTAQALLMDRSLLSKLRGFRNQNITPDVMNKVRRECLRTQAFATSTTAFEGLSMNGFTPQEDGYGMVEKIPRRDALKGDIIGILATWVRGVELEYKAKTVRHTLSEKKRRLAVSLHADEDGLTTAVFEMNVATRSLPARQEEVQVVETKLEAAERQLTAAKQRLKAFKLLQYAALNGHTALSFASAVGNEAMVHMLLSNGASAGCLPEELHACAALIQLMFREFLFRTKQAKAGGTQIRSRSDAAMEALVRNVAQTFLLGHFRRKRRYIQLTHRVPIHEAVYNGHPQILEILLANSQAKLWHKTHIFPIQVVPGSTSLVKAEPKSALELRRSGGWQLVPLTGKRVEVDEKGEDSSEKAVAVGVKLLDPRELEARLAPLTLEETLLHAQWRCESKTFLRDSGGWNHSATRLTATATFVSSSLQNLHELQATQLRDIRARKNVAKKTKELQLLHARLDEAIVRRDFHAISDLLDEGAFADYETTKDGLTPLMAACVEEVYVLNGDGKSVLAVAFLMDRPTNHPFVNFESSTGRTALSVAAFNGSTLCAQELVERGAAVNQATRRHGETAMMTAAGNGKTAFVEYLLHHREADVYLRDFDGNTAYDYAKRGGFHATQHVLGAAMSGGNRGRVFASTNALYGVCKWGCGFMTPTVGHEIDGVAVLEDTEPLAIHERSSCSKRIVECPNQCGVADLWAEGLDAHLKSECLLRRVPCPQPKCGSLVVYNQLPVHNTTECEYRMVVCECGERMTHQKHVLHARNQCSQRLVPCPLQCRVAGSSSSAEISLVKFADLKDHERSVCAHRRVRCRNGCVASELKFKDRELHETQLCVLRRVRCKWGCDETVLANGQLHHESDECLQRELACPNKCGEHVQFLSLEDHVSATCLRRLTVCSLGCGRKVPLHLLPTHVQSECRRRIVQCGLCSEQLLEIDMANHAKSLCSHRLSVCGLCGQSDIPQTSMASHRSSDCRMRVVVCRFQCYATRPLLAHQKLHHEQFECAFRPIFCPLGCGQTIIAHTLKKHEKQCEMRIVSCGNGCGVELREKEREDHERRYCSTGAKALQRGKLR